MDRLRSPGGCPWDREQTHASLLPYVVEEAHELVEAVETGTREDLLEELGDVLLQVVFHARVAQEDAQAPFDLDDVARRTAAKLVSRHPHVFGDVHAPDAEAVKARWDQLKKAEKGRESALDGVPPGLGALARAAKLASRAQRAGLETHVADDGAALGDDVKVPDVSAVPDGGAVGAALLRLTLEATAAGIDAEAELRAATRRWEADLRAAEQAERSNADQSDGVDLPKS
ncbi:MAG: MazG family protein [Actinomycetales bacterium]|nr:MazG family protein [Actinomycetales bacterium]